MKSAEGRETPPAPPARLVLVYNAEAGLFNGLVDSAHKVLSPQTYGCSLCRVTYGLARMAAPWSTFLAELPEEVVFYHRREFRAAYPDWTIDLPVIFRECAGDRQVVLGATELAACAELPDLMAAVHRRLVALRRGGEPSHPGR